MIWVHAVCHRGFLNISADDFCYDCRIKGYDASPSYAEYSKTRLRRPLKKNTKIGFHDRLSECIKVIFNFSDPVQKKAPKVAKSKAKLSDKKMNQFTPAQQELILK